MSLFCFFYPPIFLSSNSFFFLTYFAQYFAHYLAIFSAHKRFFLVYLQLLSMYDCCIRVIHNMVTALLEYLDLLAVFPKTYVDLILLVTSLVEYLHLCNGKLAKLQFSDTHFSKFSPIFPEFCSLLFSLLFFFKNCLQNRCSPIEHR